MGRSVSSPSGEGFNLYLQFDNLSEYEEDVYLEWEWFTEGLVEQIQVRYPSLETVDRWVDREDHAYLENNQVVIGISEYCGVVCLWGRLLSDHAQRDCWRYEDGRALAYRNLENISRGLEKLLGDRILRRIGSFSNGESVYEKAS
jgi:hypothetical protein